jgi:hypothetical protein
MAVSKEARKNAEHCFTLARETSSSESYAYWMKMGRLWSALAKGAEEGISGSALLHDMAQMWIALANELGARMHGRRPRRDAQGGGV